LIRLVTGASWVDIEAILDFAVSDTTLRARRDEWSDAGVFEELKNEALAAFDRIIGLDLDDLALDGSLHKAPCGGEGTGPNPTDRAKLGWKWSVACDRHGIPIGCAIDDANRNDVRTLEPTLDAIAELGLLVDVGTLQLDRGYDSPAVCPAARCEHRPVRDPAARHQGLGREEAIRAARVALDRRSDEHLVVELRATPTQRRRQGMPPTCRTMPRDRRPHRRQTPRLPRPLEPKLSPNRSGP
jgi:hypothetical protein